MLTTALCTRVLEGFDDHSLPPECWDLLLQRSDTDVVFLTWALQRSWWETLGEGELLLIAAERAGQVVALAPFYTKSGMVFFIGSSFEFDTLDFLGDISDPAVLDGLLQAARDHVPNFQGFRFYFVSD